MQVTELSIADGGVLGEVIHYPANLSVLATQMKCTVFTAKGTVHTSMNYILSTSPDGVARILMGTAKANVINRMYADVPWPESIMTTSDGFEFKYKTAPTPYDCEFFLDSLKQEYVEIM
jgi:hypothetical protein